MAFDTGYSIESVNSLMNRMIHHHELIRYNHVTREFAIKNWGKYNLNKGGKPVIDCILAELKDVEDFTLIQYVAESIGKNEIRTIYELFCETDAKEHIHTEWIEMDDSSDDTLANHLSELLSHADIEKIDAIEEGIIDAWKEREKRNILTVASMSNWEIGRITTELDKIQQCKMDDHTSIQQALAAMYEAPWEERDRMKSVPTGINRLDEMTGGFHDGEVTLVAARPSMGKTDVMLHFAKIAGWAEYVPVIFSIEMLQWSLTNRLIASTGRFNRSKMKNPKKMLSQMQKDKWPGVLGNLNGTNIQIIVGGGQRVAEMRAKTRKIMSHFPNR